MALQLKRRGITRVRPLEGGMARWMALSLPVQELVMPTTPPLTSEGPELKRP